jgi:phosphoglycerate dehydrogenase-like enzyme
MKIAILDDYQNATARIAAVAELRKLGEVVVYQAKARDEAELVERLRGVEIVIPIRERTALPERVLAQLPDLKHICMTGHRAPVIDVEGATRRGILVTSTEGSGNATVELTFGLMIAAMRHLVVEDRATRAGKWQTTIGVGLQGKTLGIIGLGRLGTRVGRIAQAFGMHVLACGFTLTPERAEAAGARLVPLETLLRESDVVSVHLRLTPQSRGYLDKARLALMRPTAYLVNTSRGPIVDQAALVEALRERRIAGAALDVFDQEPIEPDNPLLGLDNVVLTPHLGFVTVETYDGFFQGALENIRNYLAGAPSRVLNPEVLRRA